MPVTRTTSQQRAEENVQMTSHEDACNPTSRANPVSQGASVGPSPALLQNMLDAANESAKLVTSQRDNLAMQLHGACSRIDELEARMAENPSHTSNFIGRSAQEAKAQHAANSNDELRYKLTH